MGASLPLLIAGEPMLLMADRAIFWPRRSRLLIADLHLGKADAFRSAGIALPHGGTDDDLSRLSALLQASGATEVMVLGDFLHGGAGNKPWRQQWQAWRRAHASVAVSVLAGNHDRALAGAALDIDLRGQLLEEPPFAFRHLPEQHAQLHVMCGHLHPVFALPDIPGRWPCFWMRDGLTVLPAFSKFTGGILTKPAKGEECIACVHGELICARAAAFDRVRER